MQPIRSIAELPFAAQEPLDLLNVRAQREEPVLHHTNFGWARFDELWLEDGRGGVRPVRDALVIAVHAAEDPERLDGDIELEFFVEEVAKDYSVTVLLSKFLEVWLPRIGGSEQNIVLAMCNPHRATLRQPAVAGATPVHYALGDVDSWISLPDGRVSLTADEWRIAE